MRRSSATSLTCAPRVVSGVVRTTRRRFSRLVSLSLLTGLAGCSVPGGGGDEDGGGENGGNEEGGQENGGEGENGEDGGAEDGNGEDGEDG